MHTNRTLLLCLTHRTLYTTGCDIHVGKLHLHYTCDLVPLRTCCHTTRTTLQPSKTAVAPHRRNCNSHKLLLRQTHEIATVQNCCCVNHKHLQQARIAVAPCTIHTILYPPTVHNIVCTMKRTSIDCECCMIF